MYVNTSYAQTDSSALATQKKLLEKQKLALQNAISIEDSVYKVHPPLPFSFTDKKAVTYSLTTLHFTNHICLGDSNRFRFASFHEGPVILSEGRYTQRKDTLVLIPDSRPSAEFINAYKNYSDWGYKYDAACKWIFNSTRYTLKKKCD